MLQKQTLTVVLIAGLAGFVGGVVSQPLGFTVMAQAGPVEKIEAQEFRIVDAKGKTLGVLKAAPAVSPDDVQIFGADGKEVMGRQSGAIILFDTHGQAVWAAPKSVEPPARFQPLTEVK
ncbi:MAG: hypothetical protein WD733_23725 [Bryobacterales bacterium]